MGSNSLKGSLAHERECMHPHELHRYVENIGFEDAVKFASKNTKSRLDGKAKLFTFACHVVPPSVSKSTRNGMRRFDDQISDKHTEQTHMKQRSIGTPLIVSSTLQQIRGVLSQVLRQSTSMCAQKP